MNPEIEQIKRLQSGGDIPGAAEIARQLTGHTFTTVSEVLLVGQALANANLHSEAAEFLGGCRPAFAEEVALHHNMGVSLYALKRLPEALEAFRTAIAWNPGSDLSISMAGSVLREMGRTEEALEYHGVAVRLNPENVDALYNLGNTLMISGQYSAAEEAYRQALKIKPDWAEALNNLGSSLMQQGKFEEAVPHLIEFVKSNPGDLGSLPQLTFALREINQPLKSLHFAEILVREHPRVPLHHALKASCLSLLGRAREAFAEYGRAITLDSGSWALRSWQIYTANYLPFENPRDLFSLHREYGSSLERLWPPPPFAGTSSSNMRARLRIGYVSGDFCKHAVSSFLQPVLENHGRSKFEIYCYSNHAKEDGTTEILRRNSDYWRPIFNLSDQDCCDLIRRDEIDILVDLSGHSARNRLPVFARKPAPVQVTMIGYMQTSGLLAMDYRITDAMLDPEEISEQLHTENLIRMEAGAVCFQIPTKSPDPVPPPCLDGKPFTFGSFNNLAKINPEVLDVWAATLSALTETRMLLVASEAEFFLTQMRARGIDPERFTVLNRMSEYEYLNAHGAVDLVLDTFPFNGLNVTMNALWMGVPCITLKGNTTAGRAGFALLNRVGLGSFAANNAEEFVQIATRCVNQPEHLAEIRADLRERVKTAWCDGPRYTEELERYFRAISAVGSKMKGGGRTSFSNGATDVDGDGRRRDRKPGRGETGSQRLEIKGSPNAQLHTDRVCKVLLGRINDASLMGHPLPAIRSLSDDVKSQSSLRKELEELVLEGFLQRDAWKLRCVIAEIWHTLNESEKAREWIQTVMEGPMTGEEWIWLAMSLTRCGEGDLTIKALQTACALDSPPALGLMLLGDHHAFRNETAMAESLYRKAISHSPSLWQAHMNLGGLLFKKGCFGEALKAAKPASKLTDDTNLLLNVSDYEEICGQFLESLKTLERVILNAPNSDRAFASLGRSLWALGLVSQALSACEKAIALNPKNRSHHDQLLHILNYMPDLDPQMYFEKHRRFSQSLETPLLRNPVLLNTRDPDRRLRIAYISPDFRQHSVSYFIEPILQAHSRNAFEIWGVFTTTFRDSTTDRIERMCDHWIEASGLTDEALAECIQKAGIDIVVDLACHTSGNRLLMFPLRPAPIHITMIGMQQTTGLHSMDYRITDHDLDPPGMTEKIHSEKLLRLQRGFVFSPPLSEVLVQDLPAFRTGHITFGSFNNFAKANAVVLETWASILKAVPGSRLGAVVPEGAAFEEWFENAGISADRIFRMQRRKGDDYLRMHDEVDIALDCFPFSGLTVSLFAAWMGVPTVTLAGKIPSARGGVSVCRGLGLDDWIAVNPQDFRDRAIAFASDWGKLSKIRGSMRERMDQELVNSAKFIGDYERQLYGAWRDWCAMKAE